MMTFGRLYWMGCTVLAAASVPFACAAEGHLEPEAAPTPDAASDVTTTDATAGPDAQYQPQADAGPCSESKLCITGIPVNALINLVSIWGSSANDVWAVGTNRTILHYDGAKWEKADLSAEAASAPYTMRGVWLERPDDVWILDGLTIRHSTTGWKGPSATEWSTVMYPASPSDAFPDSVMSLSGRDNAVWIGTLRELIKADGWADGGLVAPVRGFGIPGGPGSGQGYVAIAMSRPDEVWAATSLPALGAQSGGGNRVGRLFLPSSDGGTPPRWQSEAHDSRSARFVHGIWADANDVWLVGEGGSIRHMSRAEVPNRAFDIVASPVVANLRGVFGFGSDDVWAVGEESTVIHWDGTSWRKLSTPFDDEPTKPRLFAVWGSSTSDVWIAGNGVMLHFDGNER